MAKPFVAVVGLGPPAVEDREVQAAVEHDLLAAGAAGLERAARVVEPDVDALHQVPADVDVVVLDEHASCRRTAGRCVSCGDLLDQLLAGLVVRVGLAGEDELDRPLRVVDQRGQRSRSWRTGWPACRWRSGGRSRSSARPGSSALRAAARSTPSRLAAAVAHCAAARRRTKSISRVLSVWCVSHSSPSSTSSIACPELGLAACAPASRGRGGGRRPGASAAASQVGTCTPLVMWPIGTCSSVPAGIERRPHRARDLRRAATTRRWRARQSFSASTVMQNGLAVVVRVDAAEAHEVVVAEVRAPRAAGRGAPRPGPAWKRSWPAGTGVCVVKTTCAATSAQRLVERRSPSVSIRWRISSSAGEGAVALVQVDDAG